MQCAGGDGELAPTALHLRPPAAHLVPIHRPRHRQVGHIHNDLATYVLLLVLSIAH